MILQDDNAKLKKEMKRGSLLFTELDSESDSDEEYDDCTFEEMAKILDNQFQQSIGVFEAEMSNYANNQHIKELYKLNHKDFEFLKMNLESPDFIKAIELGHETVPDLENKLKALEKRKRHLQDKKEYYKVKLNNLNRRKVDSNTQFLLPKYKIIQQTDVVGKLRRSYSEPHLKLLDANLRLLNQTEFINKKRRAKNSFISNILFVQENVMNKYYIQFHLDRIIKEEKGYFFNKFEKTISSNIKNSYFNNKSNHFSINYDKFKNKGIQIN